MNSFSVPDVPVNSLQNCSSHLHGTGQHCMLLKCSLSHNLETFGAAGAARAILPGDTLRENHRAWGTFQFS